MNKKIAGVLTVAVILSGIAFAENAQAAEEKAPAVAEANRMAVLDIDHIMMKSDAAVGIRKKLEAKREEYQNAVAKKEEGLRNKVKELTKQKSTLSEEEFAKKREAFEKDVVAAQGDVQTRIKNLEKSYDEAMAKLRDEVVKIVAEYSTQQKLGMVLSRGQVVLVDSDLDITEVIMKKVNAKVKKIDVNLPK